MFVLHASLFVNIWTTANRQRCEILNPIHSQVINIRLKILLLNRYVVLTVLFLYIVFLLCKQAVSCWCLVCCYWLAWKVAYAHRPSIKKPYVLYSQKWFCGLAIITAISACAERHHRTVLCDNHYASTFVQQQRYVKIVLKIFEVSIPMCCLSVCWCIVPCLIANSRRANKWIPTLWCFGVNLHCQARLTHRRFVQYYYEVAVV